MTLYLDQCDAPKSTACDNKRDAENDTFTSNSVPSSQENCLSLFLSGLLLPDTKKVKTVLWSTFPIFIRVLSQHSCCVQALVCRTDSFILLDLLLQRLFSFADNTNTQTPSSSTLWAKSTSARTTTSDAQQLLLLRILPLAATVGIHWALPCPRFSAIRH